MRAIRLPRLIWRRTTRRRHERGRSGSAWNEPQAATATATAYPAIGPGAVSTIALCAVVLSVIAVIAWGAAGGRHLVMETPSMCPQICVGSLVADRPVTGPLHVGEVITFKPPGVFDETYTHQIMKILPDGRIQTHGVVDKAPDPWLLRRYAIVGRVVVSLWGIGWLLKSLPLFAIGTMAWIVLRPGLPARWKRPSDRVWLTAMVLIPLWTLDPLVRATIVSSSLVTGGHHLV